MNYINSSWIIYCVKLFQYSQYISCIQLGGIRTFCPLGYFGLEEIFGLKNQARTILYNYMYIYIYIYIYIYAYMSLLDIPVVLYSLTWTPLMSPRQDETRACGYIYIYYIYIYIYIIQKKNQNILLWGY